jgi:glycosyltransferase involved in cell wall biosynthesis
MRIAVNTRLLIPDKMEGIGSFIRECTKRLVEWHPEHEFHLIFDRRWDPEMVPAGATPHSLPPQARHPQLFQAWFEWSLPYLFKKIKADIFLSPDGYLSLRSSIPAMQVLHDINFEHEAYGIPGPYLRHYRKYFRQYAHKASRIATVSEYSRLDIHKTYGVPLEKIDVVYSGLNSSHAPLNDQSIQQARVEFCSGKPYFVYVGSLHGRKNISRLLQAFELFSASSDEEIHLVLAGRALFSDSELPGILENMRYADRVHFTGRIGDKELNRVIGGAIAMVFVSLFEGFGLPILEAFQTGIPLITSDRTSMPEIAADAALLVDPLSPASIAEAMGKISKDELLRKTLIAKGMQRKELYTWDRTAILLWESLSKILPPQGL